MKIWIINHYALAPSQGGGTRHHALARRLIALGHEVTIIAANVHYSTREQLQLPPGQDAAIRVEDGVPFLRVRTPTYKRDGVPRIWNMLLFAWRVARPATTGALVRPDVILGSSPHPFAAFAAAQLARRLEVPFVLEVRDLWPQTLIDVGRISRGHPFIRLLVALERSLYRRAARIVTLLPRADEHIAEKGGDRAKVVWIPNGVELATPREAPRSGGAPLTVMYAGAHGRANALHLVLEAARELAADGMAEAALFRFVGEGSEKGVLAECAARDRLANVRFEPLVPKHAIFDVLAEADSFVIPIPELALYRYGVSPNKLFDYLAAMRPIILASTILDTPVSASGGGLVVPPTGKGIAQAVRTLLAMTPDERSAMGERGRRFVAEHYDIQRLGVQLAHVFEACIRDYRNQP